MPRGTKLSFLRLKSIKFVVGYKLIVCNGHGAKGAGGSGGGNGFGDEMGD